MNFSRETWRTHTLTHLHRNKIPLSEKKRFVNGFFEKNKICHFAHLLLASNNKGKPKKSFIQAFPQSVEKRRRKSFFKFGNLTFTPKSQEICEFLWKSMLKVWKTVFLFGVWKNRETKENAFFCRLMTSNGFYARFE